VGAPAAPAGQTKIAYVAPAALRALPAERRPHAKLAGIDPLTDALIAS